MQLSRVSCVRVQNLSGNFEMSDKGKVFQSGGNTARLFDSLEYSDKYDLGKPPN